MEIAFDFRGGMIIRDITGKTHLFQANETKEIQTAIYKYVQKKQAGQYK